MRKANTMIRKAAAQDFDRARRAANLESVLDVFRSSKANLLAFEDVRQQLRLKNFEAKGVQDIPIKQIRGSAGRYNDFTASFLPKREFLKARWESVDAATYMDGFPPIEAYQVGDAYFVADGNHRVSVARMHGLETIRGYILEFDTPVNLSADADTDEVFIKAEYATFLEKTQLDKLRPEQAIEFTVPGKYREIEYQIEMYREALTIIDQEEVSYEYAVSMWFDMIYTTAVEIIMEKDTLSRFPGRTAADLYIWTWEHRQALLDSGQQIGLNTALHTLPDENTGKPLAQAWKKISGIFKRD